jgi:hypothetical protein
MCCCTALQDSVSGFCVHQAQGKHKGPMQEGLLNTAGQPYLLQLTRVCLCAKQHSHDQQAEKPCWHAGTCLVTAEAHAHPPAAYALRDMQDSQTHTAPAPAADWPRPADPDVYGCLMACCLPLLECLSLTREAAELSSLLTSGMVQGQPGFCGGKKATATAREKQSGRVPGTAGEHQHAHGPQACRAWVHCKQTADRAPPKTCISLSLQPSPAAASAATVADHTRVKWAAGGAGLGVSLVAPQLPGTLRRAVHLQTALTVSPVPCSRLGAGCSIVGCDPFP